MLYLDGMLFSCPLLNSGPSILFKSWLLVLQALYLTGMVSGWFGFLSFSFPFLASSDSVIMVIACLLASLCSWLRSRPVCHSHSFKAGLHESDMIDRQEHFHLILLPRLLRVRKEWRWSYSTRLSCQKLPWKNAEIVYKNKRSSSSRCPDMTCFFAENKRKNEETKTRPSKMQLLSRKGTSDRYWKIDSKRCQQQALSQFLSQSEDAN